MNIRMVVRTFLTLQRVEVFLAVLLPFFLIIESALANAWAYAGGSFDWHDMRTYIALGRGLFFEVLTYSCAKLVKVLIKKGGKENITAAVFVGLVALVAILVSAGNNLGWVAAGHELGGLLGSVGQVLPPFLVAVYEYGLGLLLPVAVGVLALVDIEHLVMEALASGHLDNKALEVHESEMHRTSYLKSQKAQASTIAQAYDGIAGNRAQQYIARVKKGDMSFGATKNGSGSGAQIRTTITPIGNGSPVPVPSLPPAPATPPQPVPNGANGTPPPTPQPTKTP